MRAVIDLACPRFERRRFSLEFGRLLTEQFAVYVEGQGHRDLTKLRGFLAQSKSPLR